MSDLYAPTAITVSGYSDIHTATSGIVNVVSGGNAALVPEVARTYTGGVVVTPSFLQNFSASLDFYNIKLKNAIGSLSGATTAVQNLCQQANGTGPYCQLYTRPLPFSNTTSANFPTQVLSTNINAALNEIEGWDFETNYHFGIEDLVEGWRGTVSLRGLVNYQPVFESTSFTGAPTVYCAAAQPFCYPKTRATFFVNYTLDDWAVSVQDRWYGGFKRASQPTVIYASPRVKSYDMFDLNLDKTFQVDDATLDGYLAIQNVANSPEPLDVFNTSNPGEYLPVWNGADAMGRYFTIGIKARL